MAALATRWVGGPGLNGVRESCIAKLAGWVVSQPREMKLGMGLATASGVLHEIDVVAQHELTVGILELKNRADGRRRRMT